MQTFVNLMTEYAAWCDSLAPSHGLAVATFALFWGMFLVPGLICAGCVGLAIVLESEGK